MSRCIPIDTCNECPNRDHKGAFGRVAYIPVCRLANRDLPYTVGQASWGAPVASSGGAIPDWCPLPEFANE